MQAVQAASRRLADRTAAQVVALWGQVRDGSLTEDQFRVRAAAVIAVANAKGVSLADLGLTAEVIRHTGLATSPLGLQANEVQVDQARIADRLSDILTNDPDGADDDEIDVSRQDRFGDLARSENFLTVATATQDGMRQRGIERWVRVLSGTSCPLCTGWADGIARSVDSPMARHIGCDCLQQPIF
jgi:hypothetical protein